MSPWLDKRPVPLGEKIKNPGMNLPFTAGEKINNPAMNLPFIAQTEKRSGPLTSNFGALSEGEFDRLKSGLLSNAYNMQDKDQNQFSLKPRSIAFGMLPANLGVLPGLGQAYSNIDVEQLAGKSMGQNINFIDALKQSIDIGDSASRELASKIYNTETKVRNPNASRINREDIQNYFMKTQKHLDLAPITNIAKWGQNIPEEARRNRAYRLREDMGTDVLDEATGILEKYRDVDYTQPYRSGGYVSALDDKRLTDGLTHIDLEEMGRFDEAKEMRDANLKTTDQFAEDKIKHSNIIGMKGYDKDYARAVTLANQEQSQGEKPTHICTALYEMGDLKEYIYKFDKSYGRKVHPAIYRGYSLWGEPLSNKVRQKGIIYKIVKPIALAWAHQMAYDLSKGKKGKNNRFIKVVKFIGEGVCYTLGQIFRRSEKWQRSM